MIKKMIYTALFIVLFMLISWAGYQKGFSWGLYQGYETGYEAGIARFPSLDVEELIYSDGINTITLRDIVITGEQHIIDTISSNFSSIIRMNK